MEKILPAETLKKFYLAFRDADPTHALIQCVDIMSDDQVRSVRQRHRLRVLACGCGCGCGCRCVCAVHHSVCLLLRLRVSLKLSGLSRHAWVCTLSAHACELSADNARPDPSCVRFPPDPLCAEHVVEKNGRQGPGQIYLQTQSCGRFPAASAVANFRGR